jgi:4-amino-4-deoxy-L-arabinose transferase-like glycosyltransferase
VAAAALGAGALTVLAGLALLGRSRVHAGSDAAIATDSRTRDDARERWIIVGLLLLIVLVGTWLRLDDLAAKTLTHTEAILPNLRWPDDTWPPTRTSFYDTFWWHYHSEPHPPAHYFLIWGWTKAFGTGLFSLRLPSALFGAGTILLGYWLGSLAFDRRVGVLAAALVAFNGFQIYFSQYARVFMMGTFLGLLSTIVLIQVFRERADRRRWEALYVVVSVLAIYTQTFYWLVLAVHMVWSALQRGSPARLVRRVIALQAIVVMLGAPAMAHLLYRGGRVDLPGPSAGFAAEYLSFGFILLRDDFSIPVRELAPPLFWLLALFAVSLVALGATSVGRALPASAAAARSDEAASRVAAPAMATMPFTALLLVAVGAAFMTLGLTIVALQRQSLLLIAVASPFAALVLPTAYAHVRSAVDARIARPDTVGRRAAQAKSLIVLLALLPPLLLLLLSFRSSLLTPRGFLIFIPYLLVLVAAGVLRLGKRRSLLAVVLVALALLHVASVRHFRAYPSEEFDYAALAARMNERLEPGDVVFVPPQLWVVTPLYYYLDDPAYVSRDYAAAAAQRPERVWLLHFESRLWGEYGTATAEMTEALAGYRRAEQVEALRARAVLFVRN